MTNTVYAGVAPIVPPELKGVTQAACVKFRDELMAYRMMLDNLEGDHRHVSSVSMIQPTLLSSLFVIGAFNGLTPLPKPDSIDTVQDAHVEAWMRRRCAADDADVASRIKRVFERVRMRPDVADPEGSVISFCCCIHKELEVAGVSQVLTEEAGAKLVVKHGMLNLEPPVLRQAAQDAYDLWSATQRSDLAEATSVWQVLARQTAAAWPTSGSKRSREDKQVYDGRDATRDQLSEEPGRKKTRNDLRAAKKKQPKQGKDGARTSAGPSSETKGTTAIVCYGCGDKGHALRECTKVEEDAKKSIMNEKFQEWKDARKEKKDKKKIGSLTQVQGVDRDHVYEVLFAKTDQSLLCIADTGADVSALSEDFVNKIKNSQVVKYEPLAEPVHLQLAGERCEDKSMSLVQIAWVTMPIVVRLHCGPLRVPNWHFAVVRGRMDEGILGREFLTQILGLDLKLLFEKARQAASAKGSEPLVEHSSVRKISLPYIGVKYFDKDESSDDLDRLLGAGFGIDTEVEMASALDNLIQRARDNGMSSKGASALNQLVREFRDVWAIKLGPGAPADVPPMCVQLKPNARPRRAANRRWSAPATAFLAATTRNLEKIGALVKNPLATIVSPAHAVSKPGSEKYRLTVDCRAVNACCVPIASSVPNIETMLAALSDGDSSCRVMAKLDFPQAFWQIPLARTSQELFSVQTPLGTYTPTRMLQGSQDASNYFHGVVSPLFDELHMWLKSFLDDYLLHCRTEAVLLRTLRQFFCICRRYRLKISPLKTECFLREATFCGRLISADGVKYDPKGLQTLKDMQTPETGADLYQFISAMNWMRTSIPNFALLMAPLARLMESVHHSAGNKRTKASVKKTSLTSMWTQEHELAFQAVKEQLMSAVTLAHPKESCSTHVFTDASETHWSSITTQVLKEDDSLPLQEQRHEPLAFLSGEYKDASFNWSTAEKEAFPIVQTFERLDYILAGKMTELHTDHRNLIYIFDPLGSNPSVSRHVASKLMRWAYKMCAFRYVINHVPGDQNLWADLLTRWAVRSAQRLARPRVALIMLAPVAGADELGQEDWPSRVSFVEEQRKFLSNRPDGLRYDVDLLVDAGQRWWVPDAAVELKLRILIAAHAGPAGHRGAEPTKLLVQRHFLWAGARKEVDSFVHSCLQCLSTGAARVRRPLGHAMHADVPNKLLHFDFCYIGEGIGDYCYVLVLKDDMSSWTRLVPCKAATAVSTAEALVSWFAEFGVVVTWVSDQGSHFKNRVIAELRQLTRGHHHFSLPYTPWSNGTVEVVNRELLRCLKAVRLEFKLPFKSWPSLLPMVQSALNNTILPRLGNRSSTEVFLGLPMSTPITTVVLNKEKTAVLLSMVDIRARQILKIEQLQSAVDLMHKQVAGLTSKARETRVTLHNARTGVRPINFDVGDYVLRGVLTREKGRKTDVCWKGPMCVTACKSDFLFEVRHLLNGDKRVVHGTRLKFFRNRNWEVTDAAKEHIAYLDDELCVVDHFIDLRQRNDAVELKVFWKGFEDGDATWEPYATMLEDVPDMLRSYLQDVSRTGTLAKKRLAASLLE
jgi:RNase H-like domain found in reverse transcriptase/Reverse transcriptase (RNA-dependent DNA polymerase)/Integrase zinc binding domain/Integrase core domain/Aspartyl protease